MSYTLGSLFDGSGGFPLAGSLCGIEPVWAAEIEPYPIAVTRNRFPQMRHLGDISKVNGADIEPVDVLTFGSPCQNMSTAGNRTGIKHADHGDEKTTESGLFYEAVRITKEMREATNGVYPRFVVWENVTGAFNSNKGEDFRLVCEELIKICEPPAVMPEVPKRGWPWADHYCGDGFSFAYRVFNAQYWRTAQRRRRVYACLDLRGRRAGAVLFEREGVRGYFDKDGQARETFAPCFEGGTGAANRQGAIPYTLKIRSGCEGGGKGALVQENLSATLATNNDQYLFQPVFCIQCGGKNQNAKQNGAGISEDVCYTLTARDQHAVVYQSCQPKYIARKLTPTECARLQAFPDWWGDIDKKDSFTPEELAFWLDVRNTHAAIKGKAVKQYTEKQMLTWYNKLDTPGAKFKMWGNGVALPPTLYVMQGIADALGGVKAANPNSDPEQVTLFVADQ